MRFTIRLLGTCSLLLLLAAQLTASLTVTPQLAERMEATVKRYFQGVNEQNPDMIASCFGSHATIRDVCVLHAVDANARQAVPAQRVPSTVLVQRCLDFLAAHPDCRVQFHYGPECGRASQWVVAHWYETGTWAGNSRGLPPNHQPMAVEGQTRFLVNPETLLIEELVVTRTFTQWERALVELQQKEKELQ